jgi:hypothetical protein
LTAAASTALLGAAPPSPEPSAAPSPKPHAKSSQLARDFAERMRGFDPKLTDAQIATIASGIDDNLRSGKGINPKGDPLHNWDEPATFFQVPE